MQWVIKKQGILFILKEKNQLAQFEFINIGLNQILLCLIKDIWSYYPNNSRCWEENQQFWRVTEFLRCFGNSWLCKEEEYGGDIGTFLCSKEPGENPYLGLLTLFGNNAFSNAVDAFEFNACMAEAGEQWFEAVLRVNNNLENSSRI